MRKVVRGEVLDKKMQEAVNLLCDTVKETLGPNGNNVIIDHSDFSPFITNDGVTIALNICSDDEIVNTILELAKEASVKTNENVGDGTTTTLVLLQSIFNNAREFIRNGKSPIILKEELKEAGYEISELLKQYSHIPSADELESIACISSNDNKIGKEICEVYLKILEKDAILIKETNNDKTIINYTSGYTFDSLLASSYFLNHLSFKTINNPYILIVNNELNNIEEIAIILNKVINDKRSLVILATDYSDTFVNDILSLNMELESEIILFKTPLYGIKRNLILEDIKIISNAEIVKDSTKINLDFLGEVLNIKFDNNEVTINFKFNDKVKAQIIKLNNELKETNEKEFVQKRITMLEHGSAEILVGAETETERREAKMRYEDALNAIHYASYGVVPGSGILYNLISDKIDAKNTGYQILKSSLSKPMEQILENAGLDSESIITKIKDSNYQILYNVKSGQYEDIEKTIVLDPLNVVINALVNAISIASMLLSTTSLVINEFNPNIPKINDISEI